jgi:hypothetical protein
MTKALTVVASAPLQVRCTRTVRKRLIRTRNRLTRIVVTSVRRRKRARKVASALEEINERYAEVFKRLAK